jgi:branched-chain amino acid transport system substrate-binding protein
VKTNKRVGTLYVDNAAGQAFADPLRGMPGQLRSAGYQETTAGFFKITNDDFSNQVAAFKAAGVDIASGFVFENHFATLWKQAQQAGFKPDVVTMAAAFLFPSAMKALGAAGNGMSTEIWWTPAFPYKSSLTGQSAKDLAVDWEKGTGQQWTQPLGYAHALWEVGLGALKTAADPRDRKSVRDALRDLTLDTIVGKVDFKTSPIKSVAKTLLAGGQWRRAPEGSRFPFELLLVDNSLARQLPVTAKMELLSALK